MFYDLALLLSTPFLLQKKYRGRRRQRLGFNLPQKSPKKPVIWLHMVSMGETKAMTPIYQRLRQKYPQGAFFLSSTTATGHAEAKRSLTKADGYFYLPLDLSWVMKRLVRQLQPDLFILSESDFWPNLLSLLKRRDTKIFLLNGKISKKSANRFAKLPKFTSKLFSSIDHLCLQNTTYAKRFTSLNIPNEKITITGNLKLSIPTPVLTPEEKATWQTRFNLTPEDRVITLGSTHAHEEELLLKHLTNTKVLVVPRHPERFATVKKLLNNPNFILIDQMGILSICYQLSQIAIVGGSFLPGVGGHNIFEPIQAQIPVIFGPYMQSQQELASLILNAQAGIQTTHENLPEALSAIEALAPNAQKLASTGREVEETTWKVLEEHLS